MDFTPEMLLVQSSIDTDVMMHSGVVTNGAGGGHATLGKKPQYSGSVEVLKCAIFQH